MQKSVHQLQLCKCTCTLWSCRVIADIDYKLIHLRELVLEELILMVVVAVWYSQISINQLLGRTIETW